MSTNKKRDLGEKIVLGALRKNTLMSQSSVALRTGLTPSAVSRIVDRLDRKGLVYRSGRGKATKSGGRPPTWLRLNSEARICLGVYVSLDRIDIARVNLGLISDVVFSCDKPRRMPVESLVEVLTEKLREFSSPERLGHDERLSGVAVLCGGLTDHVKGLVYDSPTLSCSQDGYPLAQELSERLGHPVAVESEANAALAGEMWQGAGKDAHNAAYVFYDANGAAVSFCFNGMIYHGFTGHPGQVAQNCFHEEAPGQLVQSRGWWLPTVTLSQDEQKTLALAGFEGMTSFPQIVDLACSERNDVARSILVSRLEALSAGLVNVCNLLNPEQIILGGQLVGLDDELVRHMSMEMESDRVADIPVSSTKVVRGELPFIKSIFVGGASYVFHHLLMRS